MNSAFKEASALPSTNGQMGWLSMTNGRTLVSCAAAALVLLPVAAVAAKPVVVTAPTEQLVVRHVSYADLDLATNEGGARLHQRVGSAVSDVCTEANNWDNGSFEFKAGVKKCSTSAWNQAQPQIDRAMQRAREIASTGSSTIAAAAISISVGR
jgi:UrcA family protein